MTSAATVRNSTSLSVPPSQNTAPVHEFRCLYTHDVRKKQKKWQDGRVKYHTFNKRVMLYDDTLNFIDDTHWKEGGDLQAGDQLILDTGVLIDLEELLATTQTDLAPLWEKDSNKQQRENGSAPRSTITTTIPAKAASILSTGRNIGSSVEIPKQKHRSLNALLGNKKGAYGQALLPAQSPYEARKANQENDWESLPAAKRQKTSNGASRSITSAPNPAMRLPLWAKTSDEHNGPAVARSGSHVQKPLLPRKAPEISSDTAVPFSDVTLPSSPKPAGTAARVANTIPQAVKTVPRVPRPKSPPRASVRPSSPPISTESKVRHVEVLLDDDDDDGDDPIPAKPNQMAGPKPTPTVAKRKKLQFAKSQQRPMLMCQKRPTPSAAAAPVPEKSARHRRPKLLSLSDTDGEQGVESIKPPPRQTTKNVSKTAPTGETIVDLTIDLSSSTEAFDTGQSSSPRRTAVRRKETETNQRSIIESQKAGRGVIMDVIVETMPEIIVAKVARQKPASTKDLPITKKKQSGKPPVVDIIAIDDGPDDYFDPTPAKKTTKKQKETPAKRSTDKEKKSPIKKAATKGKKKTLRSIIDKSNESAEDVSEGIGSRAMEEQAKALAAAGPHRDQGAWSVEATDLFDWRPPDWDERAKKMGFTT